MITKIFCDIDDFMKEFEIFLVPTVSVGMHITLQKSVSHHFVGLIYKRKIK